MFARGKDIFEVDDDRNIRLAEHLDSNIKHFRYYNGSIIAYTTVVVY